MQIGLNFVTPLWTGGASRQANRVQTTGLLGSLRWWYEALVRGLGGYVSDPTATAEEERSRSEFDTKAYQDALKHGHSQAEALAMGLQSLGAVEYLFGATGWASLFRLQVLQPAERTALHFRTTLDINKNWLGRVFQGDEQRDYAIDSLEVPYGPAKLNFVLRGHDTEYVQSQLALLFRFIAAYGGLGARLQYGFGQIADLALPPELTDTLLADDLQQLKSKLKSGGLRRDGPMQSTPYDLRNFFHLTYQLPTSALNRFLCSDAHFGNPKKQGETDYIPCAFDLRYKGKPPLGFRRWLKEEKGWQESDAPTVLGPLDELMGPRSQWKNAQGTTVTISDDLRTASRICFSMPVKAADGYRLVIFGFAPPEIISVDDLCSLCEEYMQAVFHSSPKQKVLGRDLLQPIAGGSQ
ncbi:MAG TPA: type III-B CRISPR module RAMP protein Cmr1 [Anaerolineae bacterium]|nr:MAG: hypothetical protein BWY25_02288 [Chloroflexi bacterium ADurb.Bin222]HOC21376.1 type III-B CRISPR module RAMP protein Cmr1 [Anaerolineae bacterium]HQM14304.1 type III-B CRISPR module RAMP protein Cmr1 [Anaerolineae bacterium]